MKRKLNPTVACLIWSSTLNGVWRRQRK